MTRSARLQASTTACLFAVGVHDLEDIGAQLNRCAHISGGVVGVAARVGMDEDMFTGLHLA